MFRLYNPRLKRLDWEICSFNNYFSECYPGPSDNFYNWARKEIEHLKNLSKGIKPETEFENLVLENINHSLEVQENFIDFLLSPSSQTSIRDVIDRTMGDNSYNTLEKVMQSYNWKEIWTLYQQKKSGYANSKYLHAQNVMDVMKQENAFKMMTCNFFIQN